jgi:hypothetical protein
MPSKTRTQLLADSEMTAAIRLRLLIATERPQIAGFDQEQIRVARDAAQQQR